MSILHDYEQIRKQIGPKKYDMISDYIVQITPAENYEKYFTEYNKAIDNLLPEKWKQEENRLKEKYNILFFSDVLYKPEEWQKFEKWYNKRVKNRSER